MKSKKLKRTISLVPATSIGLGAMLGAGIFVFPGLAGGKAGVAAVFSFLIGGIIALLVAACTAELATAMPQSGGGYFFISRTFGKFWGTLVGIAQWVGLIFACAFYLVSFGEYANSFLEELNITWNASEKIFSFVFTALLLIINIVGTKKVGSVQNVMVISLAVILVGIFTYGLIDFLGIKDQKVAFSAIAPNGISSIFTTTALIFTSYLGFVQIANIGAEIKSPVKNLPRSLIGSVLIAMFLYVFIMLVCTITFEYEQLNQFGETATIEVARKLLGGWGALLAVFAGLLAALSSANASLISASRGVFALSKDQLITKRASRVNGRFGTPHIALFLVALPVAIMLIRSELEVFAEVASTLHLIIYAGICLAVFRLRAKNPTWYVPTFRLPAAKIISSVGFISCIGLVFFMQNTSLLMSLGIVILTLIYYLIFIRRKKIAITHPEPPHIDLGVLNPNVLIPIDISKSKKELPLEILASIPVSKVLLVGYQETPEQSRSDQSKQQYDEAGNKKLSAVLDRFKEASVEVDKKFVFNHNVINQIEQVIKDEEPRFILKLKPFNQIEQIVIPIYIDSQISKDLSTTIYKINSSAPKSVKVVIFESASEDHTYQSLRESVREQFTTLNIAVHSTEVYDLEDLSPKEYIKSKVQSYDLILWSEAQTENHDLRFDLISDAEKDDIPAPLIFIVNPKGD